MKKILRGIMMGMVMALIFTACSEAYDDDFRIPEPPKQEEPTPQPQPEPQTPTPSTFNQVVDEGVKIYEDASVYEFLVGAYSNDSLITRELRWNIAPSLEGPSYLVVEDKAATAYKGTNGKPQTTTGNWKVQGNDSLRNETTVSSFRYSYYNMQVTTCNTRGYACFSGKWEPYYEVSLSTSASRFSSEWLDEEIVRNDSIFKRERTMNEFSVVAKTVFESQTFRLSKEVIIDHFIKMKEKEEEKEEEKKDTTTVTPTPTPTPTPDPTPETPVKANFWVKNLKGFVSGNRVYREDTKSWSDAYLFESESSYEIVLVNYKTNAKDEEFVSLEQKSISKAVCPYSAKYNSVLYSGGNFYPSLLTVDGTGWVLVAVANGKTLSQNHSDNIAVSTGIKNFTRGNTAKPTPVITTTTDPKEVNGKKVITFTGKTSVHTVTYTVADASLKK